MGSKLSFLHHDLITPDGKVSSIKKIDEKRYEVVVNIDNISPSFLGFSIEKNRVFFNLKSTLAQLGVNGIGKAYQFSLGKRRAQVIVELIAITPPYALTGSHINALLKDFI